MAFHVACPITCRRICFCALGFPRNLQGKNEFLQEVAGIEQFLNDPWLIKIRENATVQVEVPKVVVSTAPLLPPPQFVAFRGGKVGGEGAAQVKRVELQKQAAASASMVNEDNARRFESGELVASKKDASGEELGHSNANVICQLCFSGENEGSEMTRKMLSCNTCGKKYHRSCLKAWSKHRDLFHWSSWTCPSCRICEVCQKTGDPNKFMFCKRCDGAYHCYCQQPPHKNVGHGPYLCPKHTKCHSCGSTVPGNGISVRWFLGSTCCDACGRLFVKDNYCTVCLKVYRDSESTPMVCCDICQHWVHCPCDGISDAKYMQFQEDGNLQYVCPACRGECLQVRNLEEAVQELWKQRDEADRDLIASLRAEAGLPTQEEIFDISPFSDDEDSEPVLKNENRSLKFSLKGIGDKSLRKTKEPGKKSSKKKYDKKKGNDTSFTSGTPTENIVGHTDGPLFGHNSVDNKNKEIQISGKPGAGISKYKYVDEVTVATGTKTPGIIKMKNKKPHSLTNREDSGAQSGMPKAGQGPKLVIHLGGRNRNTNSPSRCEPSSLKKGQDVTSSNAGTEDKSQMEHHESIERTDTAAKYGDRKDYEIGRAHQLKSSKSSEKGGPLIKIKSSAQPMLGKRGNEDSASARSGPEVPVNRKNTHSSIKNGEDGRTISSELIDGNSSLRSKSQASSKDHKPSLKFKISNSSNTGNQNVQSNLNDGNQNPLQQSRKEDITYSRGQRSKRKRSAQVEGDTSKRHEDNKVEEFIDANWILQKLGKAAAGKRVEIHQSSDNTWHRGTVSEVFEGTSTVSITLDDGKVKKFELGKQGIRFASQKQKH
ncbi:hypothetical protein ACS0TY_020414 [Phlomoides rotata]